MPAPKKPKGDIPVPVLLQQNSKLVKEANALYDAINLNWHRIEEAIIASGVLKPAHVYSGMDEFNHRDVLGIVKFQGKWRICYEYEDALNPDTEKEGYIRKWTPITDCNIEIRKAMLSEAPRLVSEVYESNAEVVSELSNAVKQSDDFLRSIGITSDAEDL